MSPPDNQSTSTSGGAKKSLSSLFKSPAADNYNKVLAAAADQNDGDASSVNSDLKAGSLSDKEKARILVERRNADSPTGNFVLGAYKPAGASQGYAKYYAAKGLTDLLK